MHTIILNNFSSHDRWETFTLSNASLSFFSSTGATGGFKGVVTSSAMTKSSLALKKFDGVAETIYYLHSKGVDAFIQEIRLGIRHGNDDRTSWKPGHPSSNGFMKP